MEDGLRRETFAKRRRDGGEVGRLLRVRVHRAHGRRLPGALRLAQPWHPCGRRPRSGGREPPASPGCARVRGRDGAAHRAQPGAWRPRGRGPLGGRRRARARPGRGGRRRRRRGLHRARRAGASVLRRLRAGGAHLSGRLRGGALRLEGHDRPHRRQDGARPRARGALRALRDSRLPRPPISWATSTRSPRSSSSGSPGSSPGTVAPAPARLLDLSACIRRALIEEGVPSEAVCDPHLSTMRLNDRFFSYRAEVGVCGRHGAVAVLRAARA